MEQPNSFFLQRIETSTVIILESVMKVIVIVLLIKPDPVTAAIMILIKVVLLRMLLLPHRLGKTVSYPLSYKLKGSNTLFKQFVISV
jgi:hypothetical protein